jgi:hypothetical protein
MVGIDIGPKSLVTRRWKRKFNIEFKHVDANSILGTFALYDVTITATEAEIREMFPKKYALSIILFPCSMETIFLGNFEDSGVYRISVNNLSYDEMITLAEQWKAFPLRYYLAGSST